MSDILLDVAALRAGYGKAVVIENVSLKVERHKIYAMIGPNGSGKSTILKGICNLADVFSGTVTFQGKELRRCPTHQIIRLGIAYVPQVNNVFVPMTVLENLELGAGYVLRDKKLVKERIEEVSKFFPRLEERKAQRAGTLSGGERQMLAIARGLMTAPKLLLLDEPTAGLAPMLAEAVFSVIGEISRAGTTVVLVEQAVEKALECSDYCYVIGAGKNVFESECDKIRDHYEEILAKMFLA